jgi:Mycothiol maleylpyruvate isomerase N-terminal domain
MQAPQSQPPRQPSQIDTTRSLPPHMVREALRSAYTDLSTLGQSLDEASSWAPTACAGWTVRDLFQHLLGDAQRALVAFATPARGPADRDACSYWVDSPGAPDADSRGIRATRTMASQWRLEYLIATYGETAAAVVHLADRIDPDELLATQGHVLRADDLISTLVVEAAIHHLDMAGAPAAGPLAVTRTTLDGLLGRPTPPSLAPQRWALAATGRAQLTADELEFLGEDLKRLPLIR